MHHIRPYKIFTLIESPPPERVVNVTLPSRRGAGGTSLLETMLMVAASQVVNARRFFEFGTFLGSNTLNMALNAPPDAEIFTLDMDENSAAGLEQHPADAPLTKQHIASQSSLDFTGSPVREKIRTLIGNSTTFDYSRWKRSIDLSFIDAGHDYFSVKSDTENALEMAIEGRPSCIMWHDYHNWEYPALTSYLDELSQEKEIFHVQDTMLCAWFNDPEDNIVPRLLA
jgi:hypothetical protein